MAGLSDAVRPKVTRTRCDKRLIVRCLAGFLSQMVEKERGHVRLVLGWLPLFRRGVWQFVCALENAIAPAQQLAGDVLDYPFVD